MSSETPLLRARMSTRPIEEGASLVADQTRAQVSQGDLFSGVALAVWEGGGTTATHSPREALLLNHDCDIDKPSTKYVLLCAVRPLSDIAESSHGHIRSYRVLNTFYLGVVRIGDVAVERYVDFRQTSRATKAAVVAASRAASLTDEAVLALQRWYARWLGVGR